MMDAAHQPTARHLLVDVANTVVGVVGRGRVVGREHHAGDDLDEEHRQGGTAERVPPGQPVGHFAVQQGALGTAQVDTLIDPTEEGVQAHTATFWSIPTRKSRYAQYRKPSSIFHSSVSRGRGGGPAMTVPVFTSNTPSCQG